MGAARDEVGAEDSGLAVKRRQLRAIRRVAIPIGALSFAILTLVVIGSDSRGSGKLRDLCIDAHSTSDERLGFLLVAEDRQLEAEEIGIDPAARCRFVFHEPINTSGRWYGYRLRHSIMLTLVSAYRVNEASQLERLEYEEWFESELARQVAEYVDQNIATDEYDALMPGPNAENSDWFMARWDVDRSVIVTHRFGSVVGLAIVGIVATLVGGWRSLRG